MQPPRHALTGNSRPRRSLLLLLGALVLALVGGCLTEEKRAEKEQRDRLTMEMFRELIEEGTLTPVESMEDAFAGITPEAGMGATPEELKESARAPGVEAPSETEAEEEPENYVELPPVNPFALFGKRIKVHQDTGLITKPYPMQQTMADTVREFMIAYGDFPLWPPGADPKPADGSQQPFDTVRVESQKGMSANEHWLVVTANPQLLEDVEYFINTFAASPPRIEIEAKIVEWVVRDTLDLGVKDASALFPDHTLVDALEWGFPNTAGEISGGEFLATIGTLQDGVTYAAMFEALSSFENVSIISRPKVATDDGVKASIQATTRYPYLSIVSIAANGVANTKLDFLQFGIQLNVTPQLVGTDTVKLEINVEESQQVGSAVTFAVGGGDAAGQIPTPIMSTRRAEATVTLRPGQAVILGGLISERLTERERGIPVLKDIPVLGYLFKSTLEETETSTLLFFIRPRILEGTDLTQDF